MKKKVIRITTIPLSLKILLKGQLKYMSQYFEILAVSSDGKDFEEMLNQELVRGFRVNMTRQLTPIKDLIALFKLIHLFRKEKPDIVHSHTPKAGNLAMLAAWLCRIPIRIHTVAGLPLLEATGLKRILLDFVEKTTYTFATKVYPNSFGLKNKILDNKYCSVSKIHVIGNGSSNGIDTNYFSREAMVPELMQKLKQEYGILSCDFVFIFVGRLVTDKGINELVKAFEKVHQKHPNAKLILVGPKEPELDPLHNETEHILQNHPAIILTGFQSDVRPFFSISNILTFPSYREGFPNVVMQAGAMDLPSIVTDINGCNEIIRDNVNGIIIPAKDNNALEIAMLETLENDEKRKRLAQNSRLLIIERYEQQMVWQLISKVYDEQIKSGKQKVCVL